MKILHIAAHMGGGIGSAYVGLGTCGLDQTILLLEKPIDLASLEKVQGAGFRILVTPDKGTLRRELTSADLVLFNWTHHPALTQFLYEFPEIPLRSILWCHVSGNYFPHISAGLVQAFDRAIFATPYSLELPQLKALGDRCGGGFQYTEKGVKDCTKCLFPHRRENYPQVVERFGEIAELVRKKG